MDICERCQKSNHESKRACMVNSHEIIRMDEFPDLPGPLRVSIGFWRGRGEGDYHLCDFCKGEALEAALKQLFGEDSVVLIRPL